MQLESHPLDKVAQVICTSDDIRVRRRRSTAYGDRPAVGMVGTRERLLLLRGQDPRRVSIDNRTVYRHSLVSRNQRRNVGSSREGRRTRTRTRSLEAMTVEGRGRGESRRFGGWDSAASRVDLTPSSSTTTSSSTPCVQNAQRTRQQSVSVAYWSPDAYSTNSSLAEPNHIVERQKFVQVRPVAVSRILSCAASSTSVARSLEPAHPHLLPPSPFEDLRQ